jgi:uncharacterized oxidoreductase
MPRFTADRLKEIAVRVFQTMNVPQEEAEIVAEHLVEANLTGVDSHGVIRIPQYAKAIQMRKIKPGASPKIVRETPSSALIDGDRGFGQVIARWAMSLAIRKARENVISAVSVYNCSHVGRLASYTMMAADEGMIGMMMVNAGGCGQTVAPFGGIARRLATNPISIAIPTGREEHIVLDIATSVASEGKIRAMRNRGERVPKGWIIDHMGRPTTDPNDFYGPPPGALLPLGGIVGYKGFGLGLIVDILAGGLSGAGCSRADAPQNPEGDGILMIVIDIQRFTPPDEFYDRVLKLIRYVKSSPTISNFDEILIPGEIESRERKRRSEEGIFIDEVTWRQIQEIIDEQGICS